MIPSQQSSAPKLSDDELRTLEKEYSDELERKTGAASLQGAS